MRRVVTPELLDSDAGTPAEISSSLEDLRRINAWFGGISSTEKMLLGIGQTVGSSSLSILEVAAGSGYVLDAASKQLEERGLRLQITSLDRAPSHITFHERSNGKPAVAGEALALPFCDSSFDVVSSNLFVHHLSPAEVSQFSVEGLRVCRRAFLINDLVRSPVHLSLVYAGMPLYRSRLTRHDAPASVRQAYTPDEIRTLLEKSGAAKVEIQRHYLFRMAVTAWKKWPPRTETKN